MPESRPIIVAIDGPAGAGKSTVARMVAARLGLAHIDTGATYRAAALKVLESGAPMDHPKRVAEIVSSAEIWLEPGESGGRVLLDGKDVTAQIRTPRVSAAASRVSCVPEVRHKLVALQRTLAQGRSAVVEGRDIGTVVFPEAQLKIFLHAEPEERARRRLRQHEENGRASTLSQTTEEMSGRDRRDTQRQTSPLIPAADAHVIDSTTLSAGEVVDQILQLARTRNLGSGG